LVEYRKSEDKRRRNAVGGYESTVVARGAQWTDRTEVRVKTNKKTHYVPCITEKVWW
jgi:hypothetical protein